MVRPKGSGKFKSKTNLFVDIEAEHKAKLKAISMSMNKDMSTLVRELIVERISRP